MRWPYYEHIFFDCDSTLTTVEGIDVLADFTGKKPSVENLTNAAMDGRLDLKEIYAKRLKTVNPTRRQIHEVRRVYKQNLVEDAAIVIKILQTLGHKIYIISGGLAEPVEEFGVFLGVPRDNIKAVGVSYDQLAGEWWNGKSLNTGKFTNERYLDYDDSALTVSDGKGEIIHELLGNQSGRSILIGDGISDLLAGKAVDLFVGYGGVVKRERVIDEAAVYVHTQSLTPFIALAAGPASLYQLQFSQYKEIVSKSLDLIKRGAITFQNERLKSKFQKAFNASFNGPH